MLGQKRKHASKTITEKYKILKEIDKGNSCAFVAKKHNTEEDAVKQVEEKKTNLWISGLKLDNEKTSTI